ncbi:MAG TPA: hypothetical protein VJU86_20935 [Pyrinomonadaceae bacterium]|nr:hypothetical protein [Pyrinomonadaceae bacterium]
MRKALVLLLLVPMIGLPQEQRKPDPWSPFTFFVGAWKGTGKGEPGLSQVERKYESILNGKFIRVAHKSIYAPQEKNPKGETHEDLGFISYDRSRKQFVFRQFHIESFVIQYRLESISENGREMVWISESIENVPAGYRARETHRIVSDSEFVEIFELAAPGKEFAVYSENRFTRQK